MEITNQDIIDCKDITSMPEEIADWLFKNYREVKLTSGGFGSTDPEFQNANWEIACRKGNDWKYGRFFICREKMLWRNTTFSEFYGGGIVD